MAGESPGREQRQSTSGEAVERSTADPRLVVFRTPTEGHGTRVAEGVREEHAGAAVGAVPSAPPESADSAGSGARPHPAAASSAASTANTPDGVAAVDESSDAATSTTPPAPRTPEVLPPEAEPNRDLQDPDSAAGEASEDGPDSETGPEAEDSAPAGPPAAERDEHTAVLRVGGRGGLLGAGATAGGGAAGDGTAEGADGDGVDDAEGADGVNGAEAVTEADPDDVQADADDVPGDVSDAAPASGDGQESEDADPADPEDAAPATSTDAADDVADAAPSAGDAEDAAPEDSDSSAPEDGDSSASRNTSENISQDAPESASEDNAPKGPGARSASVLRPLVSDLPAERPAAQGAEGVSGARNAPSGASAPYEAPQPPPASAKPRTGPVKPSESPAAGPIGQPSAPPKPAGGAPLPPYAGSPSAIGTPTAASPDGAAAGPDGTRSMPVPPEPEAPLKLLAELTNTPPPRQTVLRTVARRFKIWTPLVVLLAIVFVVVQALRPLSAPSMALTAASSYTFDGTPLPQSMPWPSQGQSVAEVEGLGSLGVHGAQTPVPIASVTKVMTAYLILRDHPLTGKQTGPTIPVDAQAADEASSSDESTAQVKKGQQFTERQMLQLLLIPSGNNIARLLARWDSGTQEAFVTKMTKAAADLGMTNTTYTGASGFEETTRSTAVDQLKLAREVMKNDVFRSVVAQPNIDIPGVGTIYNNNNDLVNVGVIGIKTGSSTPAGGALMWAANKKVDGKDQLILGVVLQQRGGTTVYDSLQAALVNSQKLINSVQGGLTSSTIVKKGEVVGYVDDGLGGHTPVVASKDLKAVGWPGLRTTLSLTPLKDGLPHTATSGAEVGTIGFGTGSARTTVPVVLQSDLSEPSFGTKLTRVG
ncbi:D-alanyl-D-alanine carboxypeptidase [Streptomyces sp. NPDC008079]|uniref:D-alanyl-D-alanine carboxypeptidase family protein n=1 Tax=Streptomyces sp. NPDC008079 TaxID=3364806 RepID=UPI0036F11DDB